MKENEMQTAMQVQHARTTKGKKAPSLALGSSGAPFARPLELSTQPRFAFDDRCYVAK